MRVLLRDMQEQICLKSANKGSKIWTPYFLYVRDFLPIVAFCQSPGGDYIGT